MTLAGAWDGIPSELLANTARARLRSSQPLTPGELDPSGVTER